MLKKSKAGVVIKYAQMKYGNFYYSSAISSTFLLLLPGFKKENMQVHAQRVNLKGQYDKIVVEFRPWITSIGLN
jgi:hypothetical protein